MPKNNNGNYPSAGKYSAANRPNKHLNKIARVVY